MEHLRLPQQLSRAVRQGTSTALLRPCGHRSRGGHRPRCTSRWQVNDLAGRADARAGGRRTARGLPAAGRRAGPASTRPGTRSACGSTRAARIPRPAAESGLVDVAVELVALEGKLRDPALDDVADADHPDQLPSSRPARAGCGARSSGHQLVDVVTRFAGLHDGGHDLLHRGVEHESSPLSLRTTSRSLTMPSTRRRQR